MRQHQRDRIITIFLEVVHPTVSKAGQDKMQPHEFHTASYVQCHSIYIRTVSSKEGCNRGHGLSVAIKLESLEKTVGVYPIALWFVLSSPCL